MSEPIPSIFIVDDESFNFDVIEPVLEEEGYFLSYAPNAERALDRLDAVNPDLLLLDVMMPGMDGIELCRTIKAIPKWKHIPIIMLTALTDTADLARCLQAGANDFSSKPVDFQELTARVRSMLCIHQQFRQIQELMKARDAMFHTIVHDLRNPLNVISVIAQISHEDQGYLKSQQADSLLRVANKRSSLVNDILILGKMESAKLQIDRKKINVNKLCKESVDDAQIIAAQKQIKIELNCTDELTGYWDFYLVRRTLDNLLMNAIKFSFPNSTIDLNLSHPTPDQIQFDVVDRGYGIPDEKKTAIFESYQSGDVAEDVAKIGLGLTFCKHVAEAHSGSISVRDNQPKGSIFTLILPIAPSSGESEQPIS